jgi:hypothetical protein
LCAIISAAYCLVRHVANNKALYFTVSTNIFLMLPRVG